MGRDADGDSEWTAARKFSFAAVGELRWETTSFGKKCRKGWIARARFKRVSAEFAVF